MRRSTPAQPRLLVVGEDILGVFSRVVRYSKFEAKVPGNTRVLVLATGASHFAVAIAGRPKRSKRCYRSVNLHAGDGMKETCGIHTITC